MFKRLVLTGGPCSGKTSGLAILKQRLPELGITPIFIPETATKFLGSGVDISTVFSTPDRSKTFQELVLNNQLNEEGDFLRLVEGQADVVFICDRGALDGAAYVDDEVFEHILDIWNLSVGALMSRYDGVIHLVTAADGAEKFYNLDNPARYETLEQARERDKALQKAWSGHPALRIVGNKDPQGDPIDFGAKMDAMVEEVCHILGIPVPIESERKFVLSNFDVSKLPVSYRAINISQTYLVSDDPQVEKRVRRWQYSVNDSLYFYTEKRPHSTDGLSRFESEVQITPDQYISFLDQRDPNSKEIRKLRYCFTWQNQYFELDVLRQPINLYLVEVQASSMQQTIVLPPFLSVLAEVTSDPDYKMANIAKWK